MKMRTSKTTRRAVLTGTLAASTAVAASAVAARQAVGAEAGSIDWRAALQRFEHIVHTLRTRSVCTGWHGAGLDEAAAERALQYLKRCAVGDDSDEHGLGALIHFLGTHGQSMDWAAFGDAGGMICAGAARSRRAAALPRADDPIYAIIGAHADAYARIEADGDDAFPAWNKLNDALLTTTPTTLAGAAALLAYTLQREDLLDWCGDDERGIIGNVLRTLESLSGEPSA
jgi:hypothetical protein